MRSATLCAAGIKKLSYIFNTVYFQNVEFPDSMSTEMRALLEGLLKRDVEDRLGCKGRG